MSELFFINSSLIILFLQAYTYQPLLQYLHLMKKSSSTSRSQKLNQLKVNEKLDGILALDNRGYCYYNDGFGQKNFNIHGLQRLCEYFFPDGQPTNSTIAIEGNQSITTVHKLAEGDILATRIKK